MLFQLSAQPQQRHFHRTFAHIILLCDRLHRFRQVISLHKQTLLLRGGQLVEEIMGDILPKQSTETSFELNLAMFKLKHSVKRENNDEIEELKDTICHLREEVERLRKDSKLL